MKLYLVQHADAVAKTIDPSRPLSPKGQLDAANMSTFLRLANVHVDEVVHSGNCAPNKPPTPYCRVWLLSKWMV
ncbi:MAG: hypothetical protein JKY92_09800 [Magnetovibrio sp.]|nr:hypothetical protein [Magnetovibrio sp.]